MSSRGWAGIFMNIKWTSLAGEKALLEICLILNDAFNRFVFEPLPIKVKAS